MAKEKKETHCMSLQFNFIYFLKQYYFKVNFKSFLNYIYIYILEVIKSLVMWLSILFIYQT